MIGSHRHMKLSERAAPIYVLVDYFNLLDDSAFSKVAGAPHIERNLVVLFERLDRALQGASGQKLCEVTVRLYGGWTQVPVKARGQTKSPTAMIISGCLHKYRIRVGGLSFRPELALATGSYPALELVGTLRTGEHKLGQKMVDTSIAVDAIHYSQREHEAVVIVSNDDDFVPACLAARRITDRIHFLRPPSATHPRLNDLLLRKAQVTLALF